MNILVVDDDRDILEAIRDILRSQDHHVITASNGALALEELARPPRGGFKLIMLDLMMPVCDGEVFLKALSERPEANTCSVIVMTASQKIPTSVIPVRILRKPIELDDLIMTVDEFNESAF